MKLTEILYEDVKEIWDGYLKHPFVSGIGDGSPFPGTFSFLYAPGLSLSL